MGIPIGQRIWRKWDTFSVSTYLFVRCNNHKCVQHHCEEVPKTWLLLDDSVWVWVLFEPLARGSFWYKCPLCTWDSKSFHPTPPHLTSFITYCFHTYLHHTYHTFANILFPKEPPSILPTRIDSCPPFSVYLLVWVNVSIPSGHSGTYVFQDLQFDRRPHFSRYDSWRESCHREKTPTPWMEATSQKSNPNPSQGEKECAACLLMIKQYLPWHM